MVENNDVQDKIVIRQALKKDAETDFEIIRSFHLLNTTVRGAEFSTTIEDVERERELVHLLFGCIVLFYGIWVLGRDILRVL